MTERGQSMVEMAVIASLLIFMFIGLIEVGWAILGYMKLLNDSRMGFVKSGVRRLLRRHGVS